MHQIPELQTERLLLRAPRENDFDAYVEFYGDREASHFYGGPIDAPAAWDKLASDSGHWNLRGYGQWTVVHKDHGEVVGSAGFSWPIGWPRPELTWWIGRSWRRQGFAKEASVAAISYGYDELRWSLVQTHMKDENMAAKSLVLSLGGYKIAREVFPDGVSRDIYCLPNASER